MVEILEGIKLITKQRTEQLKNVFNELKNDYTFEKKFCFEKGKIYGIIGEHGEGGEIISSLLSGIIPIKDEEIYYDGVRLDDYRMKEIGWYVGRDNSFNNLIRKSVKKTLLYALKKYNRYQSLNEVVKEFNLTQDRLNYKISNYSGEKWRASLAIGYASRKKIYCFSWMDTAQFNSMMLSSGVFRFFKKMKSEGLIIILPTSRRENVIGIADEIIEISNPQYNCIVSQEKYFIDNF